MSLAINIAYSVTSCENQDTYIFSRFNLFLPIILSNNAYSNYSIKPSITLQIDFKNYYVLETYYVVFFTQYMVNISLQISFL